MLTGSSAHGQQKQANTAPTHLALEITYWKGDPPAYDVVPNNSWFARFRRIQGWTPAADSLPVKAVNIASRVEGDSVRVIVSVHVGQKFFERQDPVASYLLRENERVTVSELTTLGLEPFEIALIRVTPKSAPTLETSSNAPSVRVVNVQPVDATFPTFKLTLLNSSSKSVSALFVEEFVGGRLRTSGMPHNKDAEALIAAGATYELTRRLNNVARPTGNGYTPETPPDQSLLIKTAVFEDGTYEGDAYSAAQYRGYALGYRLQLAQLVSLYRKSLDEVGADASGALDNLRIQTSALGAKLAQSDLDNLLKGFPEFGEREKASIKNSAEISMFDLKKEALKEIDEFGPKQNSTIDKEAARVWLSASLDRFQKWLERVQKLEKP